MMFSIQYYNPFEYIAIVPDARDLFSLVNILEKSKINFSVQYIHQSDRLRPENFGWGDFNHWKTG